MRWNSISLSIAPVFRTVAGTQGQKGLLTPRAGAWPIWRWPAASKHVWQAVATWFAPMDCSRGADNE